ncbi:bifunctional metallophosphatase/5'-nucleotidase [Agromyces aerolatus]|uniref:bifunctional metallophosphatase/5'-nucleotidase n=1 Tax=Agromyces sp. LY-1074 TaxID=3074080 RepID=UPI002859F5A5|nr:MULTISPECIES: bifunctional UDP-sugar hydrolase/5'-nucleotidase [unclassified Agromyces]MDR5698514.1 bifunctional UDP-sugar hydrolase/5'-nucleotidase [Agromyces sp. LY-1074]MDR5704808.1 bifunctional UDP-sugar hydrolase/5'-nucleotidase [Agromyces sp. LY-1358]
MPRRTVRRSAGLAAATVGALAIGLLGGAPAQAAPETINLVTVNDFHGRIEQDGAAGGAARLATAVNSFRDANPNTVFAAAGDLIGASTFTSFIQNDVPTIEALNAAGLDVSAAGNHEFDQGWVDLRDRVQGLADWEYIAANVFLGDTDETALSESWTTTLPNGVTMGFVGAVTEELPSLVSPAGIAELQVRGIVDSVNAAAGRLSDGDAANGEADVVVLLVHEGAATTSVESATDPNSAFGRIVLGADANIDAIVSGHTHLAYNHVIDGRPVISSGQYGEKFSNMVIEYDPVTDELLNMQNTVYDVAVKDDTGAVIGYNYEPDTEVAALVAEATKVADELGAVQVGTITGDLNRGLQPDVDAAGNPVPGTAVESRGVESTLGNFVADVQLWSVNQDAPADDPVDIAFMNPGGLRANLTFAPDGAITYREAANVQPFANTLFTQNLTGEQITQVLEEQWQPAGSSRPFLKLGVNAELHYTFDPAAPAGSHITGITLGGAPLDPAATYRVVANSFLAAGGDNFVTLGQGTGRADTGKIDLQSMVDWFTANGEATPDLAQRSVGVQVSAPDADGYSPGDPLTVDLSALDFTTTEPAAGEAVVTLGGVELGRAPIDRTLVRLFDGVGTASISGVIPDGLYGPQPLEITVPATGTTASLTLELNAEPVEPVDTTVIGIANRLIATSNTPITYSGVVIAHDGTAAVGTVEIRDRDTVLATVELTAEGRGVFRAELGTLARGLHLLRAHFTGSPGYDDARSLPFPVLVR